MMSHLFEKLNQNGAFMAHIYAGDPNIEFSHKLIDTLDSGGIDLLEIGIPYSDPIADGKVFQNACQRSLIAHTKVNDIFEISKKFSNKIPFVLTTYYNIIFKTGIKEFITKSKESGVKALIVPDLSYEESFPLLQECKNSNIDLIYIITPNSSDERIKKILAASSGFVYLMSYLGVTGKKKKIRYKLASTIKTIRDNTTLPIMVGFGISSSQEIRNLKPLKCDGYIMGSQLCRIYNSNKIESERLRGVKRFINEIRDVINT